ncbi:UNVERIFIED_ORG: hypothetical protein J2W38_006268 [Variovorax paradoxus]|nr:hypothetical protein [Variovorax paradoxus]
MSQTHKNAISRTSPGYGGNCSPDEYDRLHDHYKQKRGQSDRLGACTAGMSPSQLSARRQACGQCARAREEIMNQCFAGDDYNHRQQATGRQRLERLQELRRHAMSRQDLDEESLRRRILEAFPEERLPAQCFADGASLGFDGQGIARLNDQLGGRLWTQLDWPAILVLHLDAWQSLAQLEIEAYRRVFPSLLSYIAGPREDLLSEHFIEMHLNLGNVFRAEESGFLASLDDAQAGCVALVLLSRVEKKTQWRLCQEALDSYWGLFVPEGE